MSTQLSLQTLEGRYVMAAPVALPIDPHVAEQVREMTTDTKVEIDSSLGMSVHASYEHTEGAHEPTEGTQGESPEVEHHASYSIIMNAGGTIGVHFAHMDDLHANGELYYFEKGQLQRVPMASDMTVFSDAAQPMWLVVKGKEPLVIQRGVPGQEKEIELEDAEEEGPEPPEKEEREEPEEPEEREDESAEAAARAQEAITEQALHDVIHRIQHDKLHELIFGHHHAHAHDGDHDDDAHDLEDPMADPMKHDPMKHPMAKHGKPVEKSAEQKARDAEHAKPPADKDAPGADDEKSDDDQTAPKDAPQAQAA